MIVAVDDGHGIETSGKRTPDGFKENIFNDAVKQFLFKELWNNGIIVVDCSPGREDNSLQDRVKREIDGKADAFISIHYNAMGNVWNNSVGGIETYYNNGSVNGKRLANCAHTELVKGTSLKNRGVKSDSTLYSTGLYVLAKTNSPAILVECGFMDNPEEARLMATESYQKECAKEICQGICNYFGINYTPIPTPIPEPIKEKLYIVQVGAFRSRENAVDMTDRLINLGIKAIIKEK